MRFVKTPGRFSTGRIVATRNLIGCVLPIEYMVALNRHRRCDWGDVCESDWKLNDQALKMGDRLFSVYHTGSGRKFWIITEANRSVTTILLPEDY